MQSDELRLFSDMSSALNAQRTQAIQALAFLEDLIEKDRWEKYGNSYSGHIVNLSINCTEQSLILFCNRAWDTGSKSQSIPNALSLLGSCYSELLDTFEASVGGRREADMCKRYKDLVALADEEQASEACSVLRVIRTESLSHNLTDSRDREKAFETRLEFDQHGVTKFTLFKFCRTTLRMIDEVIYIERRLVPSYEDQIDHFKKFVSCFWEATPVFKEIERFPE